jgi:ubiquinone/menaquinone biosynthesis C-methylase UbiE
VQAYVDSLDRAAARLHDRRVATLEALEPRAGDRILDVGCGAGASIVELLDHVAPDACVVGIDASAHLVRSARARLMERGMDAAFAVGDAQNMEFRDGSFEAVHCNRVLMHVDDPVGAMREMARVLAPGGRLVAWEPDWDSLMFDTEDLNASRAVRDAIIARQHHPDIGRRLRRIALDTGFEVVSFTGDVVSEWSTFAAAEEALLVSSAVDEAVAARTLTAEGGAAWLSSARQDDSKGRFFAALVAFQLVAHR